ncbi:hypothetical protein C8R43DRAFT_357198 [Mycena crocata]|nr:hypothetical protein C8R43DRAFT_357198 [Mycena crocata]
MKRESSSSHSARDPVAEAARALAQAMADAQRAIAAAQSQPSPASIALAESQKQCRALQEKILTLEQINQRQNERLDSLATERDVFRVHADARERRIEDLTTRLGAAQTARARERAEYDVKRAELEHLKAERAALRREQAQFAKEKSAARNTMAGIKRSFEALQTQISVQERMFASADDEDEEMDAPSGSNRKRQKTENSSAKQEFTYTRTGRRVPKSV